MARAHFKKLSDGEKRSVQMLVRWTQDEALLVRKKAKGCTLQVNEFVRRAALGRRVDVDFVTDIVLELSDLTRAIREMHAEMTRLGIAPPEERLLTLILEARAAMLRIAK